MTHHPQPPRSGQLHLRQAVRVVRPTVGPRELEHLLRVRAESPTDPHRVREVLDLMSRACELAIATGASSAETTAMALRLGAHFRVPAQIDVTYTSITLSAWLGDEGPLTHARVVKARADDYARLALLERWCDRVLRDDLDLPEAWERFDQVWRSPRTYREWVVVLAAALLGFGFATSIGGSATEGLLAGTAAVTVRVLTRVLGRRGTPTFFLQAIGAAIPTLFGVAVMGIATHTTLQPGVRPSVVVAAGLAPLLTGLSFVAAAQDALDGYHVTAGARMMEVLTATVGIAIGVMGALATGFALGVHRYIAPGAQYDTRLLVQLLSAALIGTACGVMAHGRPVPVLMMGILGALGMLVAWLVSSDSRTWPFAAGVGALCIGVSASLVRRRLDVPVAALVSGAIAPLLPGLLLYRGLYGLLSPLGDTSPGSGRVLGEAAAVAIALAVGVSAGRLFVQGVVLPADDIGRRALRTAVAARRSAR